MCRPISGRIVGDARISGRLEAIYRRSRIAPAITTQESPAGNHSKLLAQPKPIRKKRTRVNSLVSWFLRFFPQRQVMQMSTSPCPCRLPPSFFFLVFSFLAFFLFPFFLCFYFSFIQFPMVLYFEARFLFLVFYL